MLKFKRAAIGLGASVLMWVGASASANIIITPIFDSTITNDTTNKTAIETGINNAIAEVESKILNPISVTITFQEMGTGLGQSSTFINSLSYSQYRTDLINNQTKSANDITAIATLPATTANPVNGTNFMTLTLPLLRAIGEPTLGNNGGSPDGTIGINTSITNLSRTGPQDSNKYDLQAVAMHEISEVLGTGGNGSELPTTTGNIGPLDLFRYGGTGTRSFTTSTAATAYFSIDGGVTHLSPFNQSGGGADYADWGSSGTPQVQDAFGTPGSHPDLDSNEVTAFDVVGYNVVPEPASVGLVVLCGAPLLLRRKLR